MKKTIIIALVVMFLLTSITLAASVKLGIDNVDEYSQIFFGKRVGLITNPTGVNGALQSTINVLMAKKINLVALYGPEHGVRGNVAAGEYVDGGIDAATGLPIYSLYGKTRKPTAAMLKSIDVLAIDIQDIGARDYTYIYTMAYAMQAAAENNIEFVVFDRPNPLGGVRVEGQLIKAGNESFIGMYPIAFRHGMTMGELARYFNDEFGIHCRLKVVPMTGWKREMLWPDTGLQWVITSPNIPTFDAALAYGVTTFVGCGNVSIGVGTTRPFEFIASDWLNADQLAAALNARNIRGVYFRPAYFTPFWTNNSGKVMRGVEMHVLDIHALNTVQTGIAIIDTLRKISNNKYDFDRSPFTSKGKPEVDTVTGDDTLRNWNWEYNSLMEQWQTEADSFAIKAQVYYLY
ncbi:MAG: DUF1343 domain-containing protein [Negativicutes bacterium]|jgi:uncharacterized protein YbbC (DUF1343 family)